MAGTLKPSKPSFEKMSKDEKRQYYTEQMAHAKDSADAANFGILSLTLVLATWQ